MSRVTRAYSPAHVSVISPPLRTKRSAYWERPRRYKNRSIAKSVASS